jgi:hypothetical protein
VNQVDVLIRSVGADPPLEPRALDEARRRLRAVIASEGARRRNRRILIALFAALALAGMAVPAFGVANGWFGGGAEIEGIRGSAPPRVTGRPVAVTTGQTWAIVIARSDQGLCLNIGGQRLLHGASYRLGDCGYSDLRGDLPRDVRGDPSAPCIGSVSLVPCGSRPKYWLAVREWRNILVGSAAAKVASVEIVLADGRTAPAELARRPLGPEVPLNVFWGRVRCGAEEVIARDADGNVLGRRVPAWNGNPTGDPNGPRPPRGTEPCT